MEAPVDKELYKHWGSWQFLPDDLLFAIFSYLEVCDLARASQACRAWFRVANDEFLWRDLFYKDWKISKSISIAPGKTSWREEYKRLAYHTPVVQSELLVAHDNQVLHVSFSHNGEMFASSSKDGFIKVWNSSYPATVKYSADMKAFSWKYTQFSQFNETDTLLLISGVHFGSHSTSGEIAVFSLEDEFPLQCRILNKPYDVFGTWYNENYLFSGELKWLGHMLSGSVLWLNKASQETDSEYKSVVTQLYRFYNKNSSSIRTIMVANCYSPEVEALDSCPSSSTDSIVNASVPELNSRGNPLSYGSISVHNCTSQEQASVEMKMETENNISVAACTSSMSCQRAVHVDRPFHYNADYRSAESRQLRDGNRGVGTLQSCKLCEDSEDQSIEYFDGDLDVALESYEFSQHSRPNSDNHVGLQEVSTHPHLSGGSNSGQAFCARHSSARMDSVTNDDDDDGEDVVLDTRDKYLIFTTGSKTYTPHQIGFKRIKPFVFKKRITLNLKQRIAEQKERLASSPPNFIPLDEESIACRFDKIDHVIDLHGHIIGMALSPDHRYLYVNSRPWPNGYTIKHPLDPPQIAQEIDIHVIDMMTLKEVGTMLCAHKAYTLNDECFFIFLDVCNDYVASGAEDQHGYLWDRHYGICLAKLPHYDVVNSVAFNPVNSEMLITVSDDFTLKIWRSRALIKSLALSRDDIDRDDLAART